VRARIAGTGSYCPERAVSNADLEKTVATTDAWIFERTGIRERRIAADDEATSDLAYHAARRALEMAGVDARELQLIIVATTTPDMLFPSTACLVQHRLGATRAVAFDLAAACSGFLFGLSVADQYIHTGQYETVLLIGAEVMSRITDWTDRSTCILFGDGAGAVVLRAHSGDRGVLSTHIHSDGALWDLIQVPGGGSRMPPSDELLRARGQFIRMKGNETFRYAVRTLEEAVHEALKANGITIADIALLIPHQANIRILRAVADRLGLPPERVMLNLERFGNTSAASVAVALDEAVRSQRVREGDLLLLESFGAGLTWGAACVRW
jgi:3-oxoacyl-[acyl-carrier-protein] synthase-3